MLVIAGTVGANTSVRASDEYLQIMPLIQSSLASLLNSVFWLFGQYCLLKPMKSKTSIVD